MGLIKNLFIKSDKRCLYKFVYNLGVKGSISFSRFQKRQKKGLFFPAFHFISITDDCNLHCQGCWAIDKNIKHRLDPEQIHKIINQTKEAGSYFFGILGGEPLMYKSLTSIFLRHSDCYFQLFTNGTLLTPKVAEQLRQCGNVSPLISFEGDENVADIRRGGKNVFQSASKAIENSTGAGLITGVAVSVCKSNFEMALSPSFINELIDKGVVYLWYYIYRAVGPKPEYNLALSSEDIQELRNFIVEARTKYSIAIIDTYWDSSGKAFCPAAAGLSHHINAAGYVEPCPVIQFSTDNINEQDLTKLYRSSDFLNSFREAVNKKTRGCIVMEDPAWLESFVKQHHAIDTSGRNNEAGRLLTALSTPSHASCNEIPEKSRLYRFAKKRAFFGLGAYG